MVLRTLMLATITLIAAPSFAWEFIVGGGMTQPRFTSDYTNTTVKIEDYEVKLDNGFKAYARFNFTPYFGIQAEAADYGMIEQSDTISAISNNVPLEVTFNLNSEIKATNYSLFIGSNRDDFFSMFGKFGYSAFTNQLRAQVLDQAAPTPEIYLRDEKIEDKAPLLGFGVSFRLPWNVFILAEYEIINGDDQDIESANALVEYRF